MTASEAAGGDGPAVLERQGSIAAVLLASIGFAGVVVVLQLQPGDARWPDLALLLFVTSALLLIGCVQAIFWARGDQGFFADAARLSYNLGTLALVAGLAVLVLPGGEISPMRGAAFGVACVGLMWELVWVVYAHTSQRRGRVGVEAVALWRESIDSDLTGTQKKEVRAWLASRGLDSAEKVHAAMLRRGEGPFGLSDLQGTGR